MTEQKNLKKLVRERMARTGETYTTARRRVLARRPGQPGLRHRESRLVAHVLAQAGYLAPHTGKPYTEAMVCGLGGGIGFLHAVFEYADIPPLITIVMQHHPEPWLPAVLGKLGIPYTEDRSGKVEAALAALDQALDGGRAVWCTVDRTQLPWWEGCLALPQDPHYVVVTGRSGDTFAVLDRGDEPVPIGRAQFAQAWSGHKKGRHHRVTVTPGTPVDLPAAIRAAIATTVAHLTGPVLGNNFDVNFGFSGMSRLAASLRDGRTKAGWLHRFAAPNAFAAGLRRLHDCLEVEYTAPGGTRPLYADYLAEAAGVLDGDATDRLREAAEELRRSGEQWSALAGRAAEASDSLGELADLTQQQMAVIITQGPAGRDQILVLGAQIAALGDRLPGEDERKTLYAELAAHVEAAQALEERGVELLKE